MNTLYSLDAYRSHDLNIEMRTSSGDVIRMDFQNRQAMEADVRSGEGGRSASFSFASLQSFQFEIESNGLSEEDKKEIEAFMQIAQPYIDNFMEEIAGGERRTPLNRVAEKVGHLLEPLKEREEPVKQQTRHDLVDLFDRSIARFEEFEKLIDESQKLLEKVLGTFDSAMQNLYA